MTDLKIEQSASGWNKLDHIYGTIYGNAIGDAIGLLTEFFNKETAKQGYAEHEHLEFIHKIPDCHRVRWKTGDWTDDTDQMITIMESLTDNDGKIVITDIAKRILKWAQSGFPELGDLVGMGIGNTTMNVLKHASYTTEPHSAAKEIWTKTGSVVAPNGGVMRTSILGVHQHCDIYTVITNAADVCKITHYDPRCVASCIVVTSAIAFMLNKQPQHLLKDGSYDVKNILTDCYQLAKPALQGKHYRKYKKELKKFMFTTNICDLHLDDKNSIGYTYKALGAGCWALKQDNFRIALEQLVMEGGDADTNGAVAGALLGCKLGAEKLPDTWRDKLLHKDWLDQKILKFLELNSAN